MKCRVVLDTNCIISALLFSSPALAWLRQSWQGGEIAPLVSKDTVNELLRVLAYPKFMLTQAEQGLLLADFLPYAETVVAFDIPDNLPIVRDQVDQMFLNLAVAGKAEALVTGDNELLVHKQDIDSLLILTANEFKDWLSMK